MKKGKLPRVGTAGLKWSERSWNVCWTVSDGPALAVVIASPSILFRSHSFPATQASLLFLQKSEDLLRNFLFAIYQFHSLLPGTFFFQLSECLALLLSSNVVIWEACPDIPIQNSSNALPVTFSSLSCFIFFTALYHHLINLGMLIY